MSDQEKNEPKTKLKQLRHKDSTPYMEETDPRNPFGPNYQDLPYDTKVYYKFNKVRKYVHFDKEDQDKVIWNNYEFVLGSTLAIGLTMGCAYGLREFLLGKQSVAVYYLMNHQNLYYGFFFAGSCTWSYYYFSRSYMNDICKPFLDKYLDKAVENGFQDYEISKYSKPTSNWWIF